ncbi:Inosine-5'-monophosphate dehydrogenase [uncultured archaeon]|nr:Inosine-5'-monophosphate dehydrogenase [uncultured archaeon]
MEESKWIREQRKKLDLTQGRLAKMAGVSQSLVAKIEAGSIDAAYSKVKRIIDTLEAAQFSREKAAKDIMHSGVSAISPKETVHAAAQKMRQLGISQLPVVDSGHVVGSISEQAMLAHFSTERGKASSLKVGDIMEEAFPTALISTPLSAIASLLRHHPAVLVMDKGRIAGIITKADILKAI